MEMLMNTSLLLKTDLWQKLIGWFAYAIGNYGWAIIVFTICLKLVMLPLDILQRVQSQKQTRVTAIMQPEVQALQAKYANDREKLNAETNKLYKKYNVNLGGMCLTLLGTMVLSLVVFFTLFASLKTYGNDKLYSSYSELESTYISATESDKTGEDLNEYIEVCVKDKYTELKRQNSWLWVKNVWKGDTTVSQFVDFNEYANYKGFSETEKADAEQRYNSIVGIIDGEKPANNGCYVLIIMAVAISFLSQFVSAKLLAPKGTKINTMNKVMFVVIPLSMFIFTIQSNVIFALYVIVNSIMATIISTAISLILKAKDDKRGLDKTLPLKRNDVVEYSRNYKK